MTMLKGNLYDIVSRDVGKVTVELNGNSGIYAAHFPGHPITPGVTIVQIAVELLSLESGRTLDITQAKNIKFLVPVIPEGHTRLSFCFVGENEIKVYLQDILCTTMSIKTE